MRLTFLLAALSGAVLVQQPPVNTEVFLATLRPDARPMIAGPLTNLSNSPGYDSQPSFLPDGSGVLFSSQREGTQYDIYKYDFASKSVVQVTHTPENENSPLVTPDGATFSVVQTEADKTQRLWRFDFDGTHPRLVLENVKPVGYHVWVDATHLVLYVLGAGSEPSTLQYADTTTGRAEVIESRIGRSLLIRPRTGTVSFVSQAPGSHAVVREFDPKTRQVTTLVETVENTVNSDCAWLPDGTLLMSSGTRIFAWTPRPRATATASSAPAASPWVEAVDFASAGIARITRMAVGPSAGPGAPRFVLVAEPVAK
jgi:dipeptidyl aminopeptidase/acylaminoacyl peptidase